jgi:hypothetical protein
MNIEKIQKLFLSSKLLLFTVVFAFIAVRLYPMDNQWNDLFLWGSLAIQLLIAFFLLHLNHTFNIIQIRTFLPSLFYLLLIGSNPIYYNEFKGSIATLCYVLCYYFVFSSYQNPKSQANALNISLLLVVGSLFWAPLLFVFPVIWLGFYRFQCLNARVFFANLTGFVIVYLFIFTYSLYQKDEQLFLSLLPQLDALFVFYQPDFTVLEWITAGLIFAVYLVIGFFLFIYSISERLWTISILRYFYLSAFVIFIFFFMQSEYKSSWGLIINISVAFLAGHFFSRSNQRVVQWLLLLFFLFFIGTGIVRHI